jgi:hypothetical protein
LLAQQLWLTQATSASLFIRLCYIMWLLQLNWHTVTTASRQC